MFLFVFTTVLYNCRYTRSYEILLKTNFAFTKVFSFLEYVIILSKKINFKTL